MPELRIDSTITGDLKSAFGAGTQNFYFVPPENTDSPTGKESRWNNRDFNDWWGYYKEIPEFAGVVDARADWTVGLGYDADPMTKLILDGIRGNGFDTFTSLMRNASIVMDVGGDSYMEIIRDDDKNLINLKPLDPAKMIHVFNEKGMFKEFELEIEGAKNRTMALDKVFYIPRNRGADEMHGNSMTRRLVKIIKFRNGAMQDWDRVLHRNIDPILIFKLDTDDPTEIAAFKVKADRAKGTSESMYIPLGAAEVEPLAIAPNASLNPLATIESYNDYFYEAGGTPKIIMGNSKNFTDASSKMAYLGFKVRIRQRQLYFHDQIGMQLGMYIKYKEPPRIENDLISDNSKDVQSGLTQPNDATAEVEGRT